MNEIYMDCFKFALAVASIFHPAAATIEPAVSIISKIYKANRPVSATENHLYKTIENDLNTCIKKVLESIKKDAKTSTLNQVAIFLSESVDWNISDIDNFSNSQLEAELLNRLNNADKNTTMYLTRQDIQSIISLFNEKFKLFSSSYPTLACYYQYNILNELSSSISTNTENIETLKKDLKEVKEHNLIDRVDSQELKIILDKYFQTEQENSPSIRNLTFFEELLPSGAIDDLKISITINKDRDNISLKSFFNETWKSQEQNHISITGIGGIGKTVALFNMEYPTSTIYIPLRELPNTNISSENYLVKQYIITHTLSNNKEAYSTLMKLCNQSWQTGPSVILLLDGLNEMSADKLTSIICEIQSFWAKLPGVQIITTSRYDLNNKLKINNMSQVRINPLSKDVVLNHLLTNNIEIPPKADRLWSTLDTPLLLMLFTSAESVKKSHHNSYARWRKPLNSGSIIWNFIQSEMYRDPFLAPKESIISLNFLAPFICYNMVLNNEFNISVPKFKSYLKKAYEKFDNLMLHNSLPSIINEVIDEMDDKFINKDLYYNLLTKNFHIFTSRNNKIYLSHQHFRDFYAAVYILQVVECASIIPEEWCKSFDQYVTMFISDLLITEDCADFKDSTWSKVWNFNHQKKSNVEDFIKKMLDIYKTAYGNDISNINFSEVDFTKIPLTNFILTEKSNNNFNCSLIAWHTFFGSGHSDTVTSVSWNNNCKFYLSASHDCTVRIFDASSNESVTLKKEHKHYIRNAQFSPTNTFEFASCGDDQEVLLWKADLQDDSNFLKKDNWSATVLGTCSNWIKALSWDNTGNRIICGDDNGEITLFTTNKEKFTFTDKHQSSVKSVKWSSSKSSYFASGDNKGTVYVWDTEKGIIGTITLNCQIVSIEWLQNDSILLVASSESVNFFSVNFESHPTSFSLLKKISYESETISCVTSRFKNDIDHVAIFTNSFVEIFSVLYSNDLSFDQIAAYDYKVKSNRIFTAAWNDNCNSLICGSRDGNIGKILVLNDEDRDRISYETIGQKCSKAARCSSWSFDGKKLAIGYDDASIRIWDPFTQVCIAVLTGHTDSIKSVGWSPDGKKVISGSDDNTVRIWHAKSPGHYEFKTIKIHKQPVNCVLWTNSNIIISASDDNCISFYNNGKSDTIKAHKQKVYSLAISPDEKHLISAGNDDFICYWDIYTHEYKQYPSPHNKPIRAVSWCGNYVITASNDCTIALFNTESHDGFDNNWSILPKQHDDFIYGASISKNGLYIIGGSTDTTVGFWDLSKKIFLHNSDVHSGFVWNVSSSPKANGKYYIATSSSDGTVKIWDVSDAQRVTFEPRYNLPVIPNTNIVGCDFSGAIIEDDELKNLLISNGGKCDL